MKKVSIIIIILVDFLISYASGLPVHFEVSKEVFENLYSNFSESFPDVGVSKEELKREFTRGAIFPDLYRFYKDGILLDSDWLIANIVPYIDYDLSFYLQRDKMIEYGEIENEITLLLNGEEYEIADLHEQGAFLLFSLLNYSQYLESDENTNARRIFHVMGVYSHLLEDMYADLMWVGYLADYYGFGDFTDPKLYWEELIPSIYSYDPNEYNCLDAPARFLDGLVSADYVLLYMLQGGIDLNQADSYLYDIDDEIFNDVFEIVSDSKLIEWLGWTWLENIDRACDIYDIMIRNEIVNNYFNKSQEVNVSENIDYQTRALSEIINMFKYHDRGNEVPFSMIPSIIYNEYNSYDFNNAINMNKSVWNAQTDKGLNECVKKSLISQLYDKENLGYNVPNLAYMRSKYVSVPEIMIYDVQYTSELNGDEELVYDPNNEKHYKKYMYAIPSNNDNDYDELKISIDIYSPIYSTENLKNYLANNIEIGAFDKIEIKMALKGSDLYGNEYLLKEQNYNIGLNELSLSECLIDGRQKLTMTVSKNEISSYYSIWPELSVKPINSDEFKVFYTVNLKEFYQNQILNASYNGRYGRRHKMQIISTTYPTNVEGIIWNKSITNISRCIGSKALINNNYFYNIKNQFIIDYAWDKEDEVGEFNIRIKTPENIIRYVELKKPNEYVYYYSPKEKKLLEISYNEIEDKINTQKEGDVFCLVFITNYDNPSNYLLKLPLPIWEDVSECILYNDKFNYDCNTIVGIVYKVSEERFEILDRDVKRIGEGPMTLGFEDKTGPQITVSEPVSRIYSYEFDTKSIPIDVALEDLNNVKELKVKLINNENIIPGHFTNVYLESGVALDNLSDSLLLSCNKDKLSTTCNFKPDNALQSGRYYFEFSGTDNYYFENRSVLNNYIYIDKENPYVLSKIDGETIRVASKKTDLILISKFYDNFDYISNKLQTKSIYFDYFNGSEWVNSTYSFDCPELRYGLMTLRIPINEIVNDGLYKADYYLQDMAGNDTLIEYIYFENDNTPPEIEFITEIADNVIINGTFQCFNYQYQTNERTEGNIYFKNSTEQYAIHDAGNINDESYISGTEDNINMSFNSEDILHFKDGKYKMNFEYMDDLQNSKIYKSSNLVIDRKYPQVKQLIAEPFIVQNGEKLTIKFIISEEDDQTSNKGKVIFRIVSEGNVLNEDSIRYMTAYDDTAFVEYEYTIPEHMEGKNQIEIVTRDSQDNVGTFYVNYIVNTLGVMITSPLHGAFLDKSSYVIRGFASDPDITNSYNFKEYKLHFLLNDVFYNTNIYVPSYSQGDSANISKYPVNQENILGYIDLKSIYETLGASDIKVYITAIENATGKTATDTCTIHILEGEASNNPEIQTALEQFKDSILISYNIYERSSGVRISLLDKNNELVNYWNLENYYCFEDNFEKEYDDKAYIYKDQNGMYFIENAVNSQDIQVTIKNVNIIELTGTVLEISEDCYLIKNNSMIVFQPSDINSTPVIINSKEFKNIFIASGLTSKDDEMIFGGERILCYKYVDAKGENINPGIYKLIYQVTSLDNIGYIEHIETFEKKSNLKIMEFSANPQIINPIEPGFEKSILRIVGNEESYVTLNLISSQNKDVQIYNNVYLNKSDCLSFNFDGKYVDEIVEGEWRAILQMNSCDGEIECDSTISIEVEREEVVLLDNTLYVPNEYINSTYKGVSVVNASGDYGFKYFPNAQAKLPIQYNISIPSSGNVYLKNPVMHYIEKVQETMTSSSEFLLDKTTGFIALDEDDIGSLHILKNEEADVLIHYTLKVHKKLTSLPVINWNCYLYYTGDDGEEVQLFTRNDNNTAEGDYTGTFTINSEDREITLMGNADVIANTSIELSVSVEYSDLSASVHTLRDDYDIIPTDITVFTLANDIQFPNSLYFTNEQFTGTPFNQIESHIEYNDGERNLYSSQEIPQPITFNYIYSFELRGENNISFNFETLNKALYENLTDVYCYRGGERILFLDFNSGNSATLKTLESSFYTKSVLDKCSRVLELTQNSEGGYCYNTDNIVLDENIISLYNDTKINPTTITIDCGSIVYDDNIDCEIKYNQEDFPTIIVNAKEQEGRDWSYKEDKNLIDNTIRFSKLTNGDINGFPEGGVGALKYFSENYEISPLELKIDVCAGPDYSFTTDLSSMGEIEYFDCVLRGDSALMIISRIRNSMDTVYYEGSLKNITKAEYKGFSNSNEISKASFEISSEENSDQVLHNTIQLSQPSISLIGYYTKYYIDDSVILTRSASSTDMILGDVNIGANDTLKIVVNQEYLGGNYSFEIKLLNEDFDSENPIVLYLHGPEKLSIKYIVNATGEKMLTLEYCNASGNSNIQVDIQWKFIDEITANVCGNIEIESNYDSLIIENTCIESDRTNSSLYYEYNVNDRYLIDATTKIHRLEQVIHKIPDGMLPNFYSLKVYADEGESYLDLLPSCIPYPHYILYVPRPYKEYLIQGEYNYGDSIQLKFNNNYSQADSIYISINSNMSNLIDTIMDFYNIHYMDSLISISSYYYNDSIEITLNPNYVTLFQKKIVGNEETYISNPYLRIDNWNTELYYPDGTKNMDLDTVEYINNQFNMNALDYFMPKIQLRAKEKGFVPIGLDLNGFFTEDSLEYKFYKLYFRNNDEFIEITEDYTQLTNLDITAGYLECAQKYGDGKLICRIFKDSGVIPAGNTLNNVSPSMTPIYSMSKDIKIGDMIWNGSTTRLGDMDRVKANEKTMSPYYRTQAYFNSDYVNHMDYPMLAKVVTVYPNDALVDNGNTPYLGGYKCPVVTLYPKDQYYNAGEWPTVMYWLTKEERNELGIFDDGNIDNLKVYQIDLDGNLNELITTYSILENGDAKFTILWENPNIDPSKTAYFTFLNNSETDPDKPTDIQIVSKSKEGIRIKGIKNGADKIGFMITDPMQSIYDALYWYDKKVVLEQKKKEGGWNLFDAVLNDEADTLDDTLMVNVYRDTVINGEFDVLIPVDSLFEGHNRIFIGNPDAFEFAIRPEETRIRNFEPDTAKSVSTTKNTAVEALDLQYTKVPPEIVFEENYNLPAQIGGINCADTIKFTTSRPALVVLFLYDLYGNEITSKAYNVDSEMESFTWNGWIDGIPAPKGEYQLMMVAYDSEGYISDEKQGVFEVDREIEFVISSPVKDKWIKETQQMQVAVADGQNCNIDWALVRETDTIATFTGIPSYSYSTLYTQNYNDGWYWLNAYAHNKYGDKGDDRIQMLIDNNPPTIEMINSQGFYVGTDTVFYNLEEVARFAVSDLNSAIKNIWYGYSDVERTINTDSITDYSFNLNLSGINGYNLEITAGDRCGNMTDLYKYIFVKDNSGPSLYLTVGNPQKVSDGKTYIADYTPIWINAEDNLSGVKSIAYTTETPINGTVWNEYDMNFIYLDYTGNDADTLYYSAEDNVGNITSLSSIFYFDMTPPVSEITYTEPSYINEDGIYLTENSTLIITSRDDMSGVSQVVWTLDGFETKTTDSIITVTLDELTDGEHTVTYYAEDNARNIEEVNTFVFIIDNTPPSIAINYNMPQYRGFDYQYVTSEASIDVTAVDLGCGVKESRYDIGGVRNGDFTEAVNISLIGLAENIYRISIQTEDNIGNENSKEEEFVIDDSSPATNMAIGEPKYQKIDTMLVTSASLITLTSTDNPITTPCSGVREIHYGYATENVIASDVVTDNILGADGAYLYKYFAVDNLSNRENEKTELFELDNTAPLTRITYPYSGIFINQSVNVMGFAEDKNFYRWKLEYRNKESAEWVVITEWQEETPCAMSREPGAKEAVSHELGAKEKVDGSELRVNSGEFEEETILGVFRADELADGEYVIRLTAQDLVFNTGISEIEVKVGEPVRDLELTGYLKPEGVWAGDYIYVADSQHKRIVKTNEENELLMEIREFQPSDVFVDNSGTIYATDQDSRVYIYGTDGAELFSIDGHLHPKGIEVKNGLIYVADTYRNRIIIYTLTGGISSEITGMKHPEGIAVDNDGNVFTCIDESNEIRGYSKDGEEIFRYGVVGHDAGEFVRAVDIDVDSKGYLWVADRNNNRVHMIDWVRGYDLLLIGSTGHRNRPSDGMNKPEGLSIVEENGMPRYVYIADTNNDRIVRYDLNEVYTEQKARMMAGEGDNLEISQFMPFPNPTADISNIRVVINKPAELTVSVFTVTGKLVFREDVQGIEGINQIVWNGLNSDGIQVLNGVYNIQVIAETTTGERAEKWSKVAIIK